MLLLIDDKDGMWKVDRCAYYLRHHKFFKIVGKCALRIKD
ncbi:hypothetical protein RA8CHR_05007 [Variovorax sp. RA8]|nr:hypothetical protein RA8CHR_05007 [Variovorax sp. RA8]